MARDKQKKAGRHLVAGGTLVRVGVLVLLMAALLHRPLPAKMTKSTIDRVAMHIIEPVLRVSYYYPSRICPNAFCMMWWTRGTPNTLSRDARLREGDEGELFNGRPSDLPPCLAAPREDDVFVVDGGDGGGR